MILSLVFCVLVATVSATICENSPRTPTQLQGILAEALKSLADITNWPDIYTPNLIVGEQPKWSNVKPCNRTLGQVANCGYPFVFTNSTAPGQGSVSATWTLLANPSVAYAGALINQSKILHPTDPLSVSDVAFQIEFSEALIWLGCTPSVTYFAHSKLEWAANPPVNSSATQILGALGDTLNNYNLKTWRTNTAPGSPVGGGATLIVYTSSNYTYNLIRKAFNKSGFPLDAINVDPFPTNLVQLGPKGAIFGVGSRSSNLTATETAYLFTPGTGFFTLAEQLFPYVRLTPQYLHYEDSKHSSISPLSVWKPKVDQSNSIPPTSAFAQSETIYEPHLWGAALTILTTLKTALSATLTGWSFNVYPQTASYFEEFGEKYIFEHSYQQHGGTGTRDNNYYFYNPGLVPRYGVSIPTTPPGAPNVTVIVGLRHDSHNWIGLGKPTPQALFWNIVYSDQSDLGALASFNGQDASLQSYNTLTKLGGTAAADPLNVIWVRVFGGGPTLNPIIAQVLETYGLAIPNDAAVAHINPLVAIHHTYVNPDTGVAPWQASLVTPVQIHIVGIPPHS